VLHRIDSISKRSHSAVVQVCVAQKPNVLILMTTGTKIKIFSLCDLSKQASIALDDSFNRQLIVLGDTFACIARKGFRIYECCTGELVSSFDDVHKDTVSALCWDPTHRVLLSRASDRSAFFWRFEPIEWINDSGSPMDAHEVEMWDPRHLVSQGTGPLYPRALGDIVPMGSNLVLAIESSVTLADPKTLRMLHAEVQHHTNHISSMLALDDAHALTSSWDGTLRLWEASEDDGIACVGVVTAHSQKIRRMIRWGESRVITCGKDRTVKVWEVEELKGFKMKCLATLKGFSGTVLSLALVQDRPGSPLSSTWLFAGDSMGLTKLFDLSTMKCLHVRWMWSRKLEKPLTILYFAVFRRRRRQKSSFLGNTIR
jgi:WD40 repeat protein